MGLPGIFEQTIFTRSDLLAASAYIRAMHPKTEIRPDRAAIKRILDAGWCGQLKIHGHRAQFHVPADPAATLLAYTRHGALHKKAVPKDLEAELRRLFAPAEGWNVVDAEWLKGDDKVFVFDLLKREGRVLHALTYLQRWEMLPRVYASDCVETLPIYRTIDKCMEALALPDEKIEGLVLKSLSTPGFADTSIIRCRRPQEI